MATAQKQKWKQELMRDYPTAQEYFIDLIIDMYERDAEKFKKLVKKYHKTKPTPPKEPIREIIGAVDVVNAPPQDFLEKYFKAPMHIKDDEVEAN